MSPFITIADVAARTGFSRQFISREISAGRLHAAKIGARYRIAETDFAAWTQGAATTDEAAAEKAWLDAMMGQFEAHLDFLARKPKPEIEAALARVERMLAEVKAMQAAIS